jgi:hypothetical protein
MIVLPVSTPYLTIQALKIPFHVKTFWFSSCYNVNSFLLIAQDKVFPLNTSVDLPGLKSVDGIVTDSRTYILYLNPNLNLWNI